MKKMVAIALSGLLLAGCSRTTNRNMENGTRRAVDDVEDGIRNGVDGIEDGVEDMFDQNRNHVYDRDNKDNYDENNKRNTRNANGVGKNVKTTLHDHPSLSNVPSYANAVMGHPHASTYQS